MGGSHGHQHLDRGDSAQRLQISLGLIVGFMAVEVVVAFFAHSLALLADAGHMFTDAAALGTALWAIRLAARPTTGTWSFARKSGGRVLWPADEEAVRRLVHPRDVGGASVLVVALIGVVVNVIASYVLSRGDRSSLNVEGAFQHILTDAAGFVATAIAGLVILTTGFRRADAIASLLVVVLMIRAAWSRAISASVNGLSGS